MIPPNHPTLLQPAISRLSYGSLNNMVPNALLTESGVLPVQLLRDYSHVGLNPPYFPSFVSQNSNDLILSAQQMEHHAMLFRVTQNEYERLRHFYSGSVPTSLHNLSSQPQYLSVVNPHQLVAGTAGSEHGQSVSPSSVAFQAAQQAYATVMNSFMINSADTSSAVQQPVAAQPTVPAVASITPIGSVQLPVIATPPNVPVIVLPPVLPQPRPDRDAQWATRIQSVKREDLWRDNIYYKLFMQGGTRIPLNQINQMGRFGYPEAKFLDAQYQGPTDRPILHAWFDTDGDKDVVVAFCDELGNMAHAPHSLLRLPGAYHRDYPADGRHWSNQSSTGDSRMEKELLAHQAVSDITNTTSASSTQPSVWRKKKQELPAAKDAQNTASVSSKPSSSKPEASKGNKEEKNNSSNSQKPSSSDSKKSKPKKPLIIDETGIGHKRSNEYKGKLKLLNPDGSPRAQQPSETNASTSSTKSVSIARSGSESDKESKLAGINVTIVENPVEVAASNKEVVSKDSSVLVEDEVDKEKEAEALVASTLNQISETTDSDQSLIEKCHEIEAIPGFINLYGTGRRKLEWPFVLMRSFQVLVDSIVMHAMFEKQRIFPENFWISRIKKDDKVVRVAYDPRIPSNTKFDIINRIAMFFHAIPLNDAEEVTYAALYERRLASIQINMADGVSLSDEIEEESSNVKVLQAPSDDSDDSADPPVLQSNERQSDQEEPAPQVKSVVLQPIKVESEQEDEQEKQGPLKNRKKKKLRDKGVAADTSAENQPQDSDKRRRKFKIVRSSSADRARTDPSVTQYFKPLPHPDFVNL